MSIIKPHPTNPAKIFQAVSMAQMFSQSVLMRLITTGSLLLAPMVNIGVPSVNWMAPGENVFSTFPGNQYATMSGISMAAALVAGLIHSKGGIPSAIRNESFNGVIYPFAGR
ncbi:hypothetical protein SAMN03080617_00847 [Algoriphagus alkaliphilus]|uniref:Uncharacterized protein n=1 Tax=Algoriphagus alkaliphilus TaxID=279824 RepID=A0A1G5W2V4_9BACT|nr:hypothetical protein SAMN03080617_00847 [Algoriphagus alkaliphilus]